MLYLNKEVFGSVSRVFLNIFLVISFIGFYLIGFNQGYQIGENITAKRINSLKEFGERSEEFLTPTPNITKIPSPSPKLTTVSEKKISWGGPELWNAVNKKRIEFGVNPMVLRDELCTIASIRLNELLELGKLDGHKGFSNMKEKRPDLAWIFDKYSNIAEFLAFGGRTPEETVSLWENTLGHRKLLTGGEYVWGCIYAQNTFAVAIAAF